MHFTIINYLGDLMDQETYIERSGKVKEYGFSVAANYWDIIYLGASINLQSIVQEEYIEYSEYANASNTSSLKLLYFDQNTLYKGIGFNLKTGIIVRPVRFFRLGFSYATPTLINYNSQFQYEGSVVYNDSDFIKEVSPIGSKDYTFISPPSYLLSGALFIGGFSFVSADYEIVDYSKMHYQNLSNDSDITELNNTLATYGASKHLKLGSEFRYNMLAIRAGYSNYLNTRTSLATDDQKINSYTFGLGYKAGSIVVDFAIIYSDNKRSSNLFESQVYSFEPYKLNTSKARAVISFNFRF